MKFIKKEFIFLIVLLFSFGLWSCKKDDPKIEFKPTALTIYTVNDFHGSLEEDNGQNGIARVAGYINQCRENSEQPSVVVSAGDMFQGSSLSNYNHGLSVIEMMNYIGFDAMAVGNHEFDWTLDEVLKYRDGNKDNGEANFPYISCNIIEKETSTLPEKIDPYTIVEKSGVKVGIIGYMGEGIEDDIATQMVAPYEFKNPVSYVRDCAKELRTKEDCDIVIAVGHDASSTTDKQLSKLSGDERIDAIVNGHSHATYVDTYRRDDGYNITCVQAGSAGTNVGVISIQLNDDFSASSSSGYTKKMSSGIVKDQYCVDEVNKLVKETEPVFGEVLCKASQNIERLQGALWAAQALEDYMNVDCAFINYGGIRSNAFPINSGEDVKVSKVYQIMPFDNTIKTTNLKGVYIIGIIKTSDILHGNNITGDDNTGYFINGVAIDEEKIYTVAAVDYIFDKDNMPFKYGEGSISTGILFRDILEETLRSYSKTGWTLK